MTRATLTPPRPLLLARLSGTQEEMGRQHGQLVAGDAVALARFYRTMPERTLAGDLDGAAGALARVAVRALADAWQARLAADRPAELAARSRAFAEAATGRAPRDLLHTLATMDALQNCVALAARGRLGPFAAPFAGRARVAARPACSTVIAWGQATRDGELLFARNFDFPGVGVWDAAPAFVVNVPRAGQRYAFFARRGADTAVVTVVNEAGLVLAPHTRWHADVRFGGAMIVDLVHDLARRAESLQDAIRIARERPISSSWGIAIGSARERSAIVLEVAGARLEVVRPAGGASSLVCANRYRSPALQAGEIAASAAWALHSERRERRLRALVEAAPHPLTPEQLVGFLGDRRDVDAPARVRRLGGVIAQPTNVHSAVLAPSRRFALVGVDRAPSCDGTWAELSWSWDGPTGGWELDGALAAAGFSASMRRDLAPPHDLATRQVHEAFGAYEGSHDVATARGALERAARHDPGDPSLHLGALWLALEDGDHAAAVAHARAGLAAETEPYRRGQLLLWGTRAARGTDRALAARWAGELTSLRGDGVDELQAELHRRGRRRPLVNLQMADAS